VPRFISVLVLCGVIAAACEPAAEPISHSTLATTTTAPVADPNELIVVSTVTGSIVVYEATGDEVVRLDPPDGHIFRQPTWLDASTVVFSEISESGDHSLSAMDAATGVVAWRAPMETPPFYFSPAPADGPYATTSLRNDPLGRGLIAEFVDATGGVTTLSTESPFYTSWSADGVSLAVHIAGQHLDIVHGDATETILSDAGLYQTPVWVDAGLVTLRTVNDDQRLTVWSAGVFTDVADVDGPVGFVAVRDLIAVQAIERPDAGSIAAGIRLQTLPSIPGGSLVVIELGTEDLQMVSDELAVLYQWDREGERLLYATVGDAPLSLVWNMWSNGSNMELTTFTLQPPWFRNLVPFFDQYAQSVHLWSASGDFIGYPSVVDRQPVVVIQPVTGGDPVVIERATWAAWAPPNGR